MSELGFKIYDSNIKHASQDRPPQMPWQEFFEHNKDMAFLVYLQQEHIESVRVIAKQKLNNPTFVIDFDESMERIRNMRPNDVFFVTNPALMRGLDYGSECGIALMLACLFVSQRDYTQALGRVGRYLSAKDKRFVHEDIPIPPVDREKGNQLF